VQTGQAVEQAKAVVLVISVHSLGSRQVTKEIVRAHESGKEFIPVLRGISHAEFQNRQPEWREAVGAAASISIPREGVTSIIPRIISGLKALGIQPAAKVKPARIAQIGTILGELKGHTGLEETEKQVERTRKSEPEPVVVKKPSAETTKEAGKPQRRLGRPALIILCSVAVIALGIIGVVFFGQFGLTQSNPSAPAAAPTPAPPPVAAPARADTAANQPPKISRLVANPSGISYGGKTTITCVATDSDGDSLQYSWTASEGSITGIGNVVTWIAPSRSGNSGIVVVVSDGKGGSDTANIIVKVSGVERTVTLSPIAEETGTVSSDGDKDNSRTIAGDDENNIGYRAFWSFDISSLQGAKVESAKLGFGKTIVRGDPFPSTTGLGGLWIWRVDYGDKLPSFTRAGTQLQNQRLLHEQPIEIDVTPEVVASNNRFQLEAAFLKPTNGNSVAEFIEWSDVTITVTYSEKR
jgi:hypothetical protein